MPMQKVPVCSLKMFQSLTFVLILVSMLLIIAAGLQNTWGWTSFIKDLPKERPTVRVTVQPVPIMVTGISGVKYESCTKIPQRPSGEKWPEEDYVNLPKTDDIRDLADPYKSRVLVHGNPGVSVGDSIYIRVELYDGHGKRKQTGGDLVRVWIKEHSIEASATAAVTDNNDGSYSATLTAFWEGHPRVMAAIISPREVIAIQFRRRYICPPILINTANFERLKRIKGSERRLSEETPCNFDPQVSGYPTICNLTEANFGRPWYCGNPRSTGLECNDWVKVSDKNLWILGQDQKILSDTEKQLLNLKDLKYGKTISNKIREVTEVTIQADKHGQTVQTQIKRLLKEPFDLDLQYFLQYNANLNQRHMYSQGKYKAMVIPSNISLNVQKVDKGKSRYHVNETCYNTKKNMTWSAIRPTGYLYNRTWTSRYCSRAISNASLTACLINSRIMIFGDSTSRQMFEGMRRRVPCSMVDDDKYKHHSKLCVNKTLNYQLFFKLHSLPFCTTATSKTQIKPLNADLPEIIDSGLNTILVLHMFAHFMNYHSHVFYEALKDMKESISHILKHTHNISIVIKGPHTFSFSKKEEHVMWMPDKYSEVYHTIIRDMFMDISDKVMYLDCQDITISSEQWHIHPEDYIVDALIENVLNHVCPAAA